MFLLLIFKSISSRNCSRINNSLILLNTYHNPLHRLCIKGLRGVWSVLGVLRYCAFFSTKQPMNNIFLIISSTSTRCVSIPLYMRVSGSGRDFFLFHFSSTFQGKTTCFTIKYPISYQPKDCFFESKTSCFVL